MLKYIVTIVIFSKTTYAMKINGDQFPKYCASTVLPLGHL